MVTINEFVPVPMKREAVAGALPLPLGWNGVAVDVGKDSSCTRTGRWRRRDSVKNLAYDYHQ